MSDKLFGHLEGDEPPLEAANGTGRTNPFGHLEIGETRPLTAPPPPPEEGVLCAYCHKPNAKTQNVCWSCSRPLRPAAPAPPPEPPAREISLVLDGFTYNSTDTDLPPDIKDLFKKIQTRGYSKELMDEWRRSRRPAAASPAELPTVGSGAVAANLKREGLDVEVLEGRRRSFIRIEETTFTSDDPAVPAEIKRLFDYLAVNGVTPQLMASLRRYAKRRAQGL